jgi:hypothetical protein
MYIYTFLLGMSDTMTSQNSDLSSWDTVISKMWVREIILNKIHIEFCLLEYNAV